MIGEWILGFERELVLNCVLMNVMYLILISVGLSKCVFLESIYFFEFNWIFRIKCWEDWSLFLICVLVVLYVRKE